MIRICFIFTIYVLLSAKTSQLITQLDKGKYVIEDYVKAHNYYDNEDTFDLNNKGRRKRSDTLQDDHNEVTINDDTEPGFDLTDAEKTKFKIWPDGIIPYYIDKFSFDEVFRDKLRSFLLRSSKLTGLRFAELQRAPAPQARYVFFINRQGLLECQDYTTVNFTSKGVQRVVIGYDCFSNELGPGGLILAVAGVPPMHRAPNRNHYITFHPNNTIPGKVQLFDILPDEEWIFHDIAYDWRSAGHYYWHKYTLNGQATIIPKIEAPSTVGEFKRLSFVDVWKIKMLYNFKAKKAQPAEESYCNKLFKPGRNFASHSPQSDDELTPRAKPNKYLGIPETVPDKPNNDELETSEVKDIKVRKKGKNGDAENYSRSRIDLEMVGKYSYKLKHPGIPRKTTKRSFDFLMESDYDTYEREARLLDPSNRLSK